LRNGGAAVAALAATTGTLGQPINIATGPAPAADGYLRVGADQFGSYNSVTFAGLGDTYNPAGAHAALEANFSNGFMIFADWIPFGAPDGIVDGRELLTTNASWQGVACAGGAIGADASMMNFPLGNVPMDTDGDAVPDTLFSAFDVVDAGGLMILHVDVTQEVDSVAGNFIALLTQEYTITNIGPNPVAFSLVRIGDFDLTWDPAADFGNDSVGNDRAVAQTAVFQQEAGDPTTRITMVSPEAVNYTGAIKGITPPGGPPAYDFGTDCEEWDDPGLPTSWEDHVAAVGYLTDGESGPAPPGCVAPCDGHIDLEIPVFLDVGAMATVTVRHLYGGTCDWDCEDLPDGKVGTADLLDLLSDWGMPSACDFDGSGAVGTADLLKQLSFWGPC
jgi:hypothetical protein